MLNLSRFLANQRTRRVLPYLSGSVLDIGCGYNPLVQYLGPGIHYVGLEREGHIINWLKNKFPGVPFIQCDLNHQGIPVEEQFDQIVMMAVIEHLDYPQKTLAQLTHYIRPGGKLIMTTPSPMGNWLHHYGAKLNLFSRVAAEEHNLILYGSQIKAVLEEAKLTLVHYERFLIGGNQLIVAEPTP